MLVAAVAMVFGMVGCAKKHDCKCTIETFSDGMFVSRQSIEVKEVENDCDKLPLQLPDMPGVTRNQSCEEM